MAADIPLAPVAPPPASTSLEPRPAETFTSLPGIGKSETPRAKRAYRRRQPFRVTRARRAAARANLAKAREALQARGWPHSKRQRAAARVNIQKAQAAIRKHGLPNTPARREAALANLAKANAALRDRGYPRNRRQLKASRANLRKAWQVSHDPANYALIYASRLKHGLFARRLEQMLMQYVEMREEARRRRALRRTRRC
jgi:hypothetical protein